MLASAVAGIITPPPSGNLTIISTTDAADTVLATGGTSAIPTILVETGANLRGDPDLDSAIIVSAPGQRIDNSGFLGGDLDGIQVGPASATDLTIFNRNSGIIQGGDDGILLSGNGGTIDNGGIIRGITSAESDGIEGLDGITITNRGDISGNASGIFAGNNLLLTNRAGATVSGNLNEGVYALDSAMIDNLGSITSATTDAIVVFDNATITNCALIEGAENGIFSGSGLDLENLSGGVIRGTGLYGVDAGNNASISNRSLITGAFGGINTTAGAVITNDTFGVISGNGGDGISLGSGGVINNLGVIKGTTGIVAPDGSLVTSSGIIRSNAIGGNAFSGGSGNDNLTLQTGSLVVGNLLGGGGDNGLTFQGGLSSPGGEINTVRGNISGFATITKEGGGLALVGAVNDVGNGLTVSTDLILITEGGLYLNADISGMTGPQATIDARGTALGGTGSWNADVILRSGGISAGAIPINLDTKPENAVGALAIFGDVTHQLNSFIRVDIVPDTLINEGINSDIIEVIGQGNVYDVSGADIRLSPTDINKLIRPGAYIIVDSDEPIAGFNQLGDLGVQFNDNVPDTGRFTATGSGSDYRDSVLTNLFVTPVLRDGGSNLVLDLEYRFGEIPGLSRNQSAIGDALDRLALRAGTDGLDEDQQDLLAALALSDVDAVSASLAALDPQASIALATSTVNSNYRTHLQVQDHLAMVRGAVTMTSPQAAYYDPGSKGAMPSASAPQVSSNLGSVWGSVSYDKQDYENSGQDFDGDIGALTVGVDYRVSPMFIVGGLVDGSKGELDYGGGESDLESIRVAVYGTYGAPTGFYSDFLVGYGWHDLDQTDTVGGIGGIAGSRDFSTDADSLQALLTAGFAMGNDQVRHGPYVGLEYQDVDVDGYSLNGVSLGVGVDDYKIESFRGLVGYRVNATYGAFRPYASVTYAHEFEDGGADVDSNFGGSGFTVQGPELQSSILVTAGAGYAFSTNLMLDVGYRGDIAVEDDGLTSHGVSLGLTYTF